MTDALISLRIWLATRLTAREDRGASLVEYALLVALIALVCFAAVDILGGEASDQYNETGSSFSNAN